MGLNYHNLKKYRRNFLDITGLKVEEFEKIVEKVRPEWEKIEKQKKCHGRKSLFYRASIRAKVKIRPGRLYSHNKVDKPKRHHVFRRVC
ncbi:hypothetical protein IYZ83_005170 [Wolbachia pipientis]|uniref:hypothetical protein n=1 Tax=Wolbachia pipientis TaxID=955 RepID=UPI001F16FC72|nr:hypothetical protein [Wolbachia pipientis]UIP91517.1 hypothetical protein IYZ83_005170 [Wolbachia pipientis]